MKPSQTTAVLLVCILCLAAALRLALVLGLSTYRDGGGAYEHAKIASSLVRGEGFSFNFFHDRPQASSHQAPALPLLLAVGYRTWGVGSPAAHLALQLLNVVLGVAATASAFAIGRRLGNDQVGLWAAAGTAVYLPLVYMTTRIQSINWSIGWLLVTLALVLSLRARATTGKAIAVGVSAALGILGEPILLLPLATFWLLPLAERFAGKPIAWRPLIISALATIVVMLPWTIRNYHAHGRWMAVKSTFWYVFWQGNNLHATGVDKLAPDAALQRKLAWRSGTTGLEAEVEAARRQAVSVDSTLTPRDFAELHALPTEVAKVDWFEKRAKRIVADHPTHYAAMCWQRLLINFWFDPTNPRSYVLAYRLPYLLLLTLALAGVVIARRGTPLVAGDWVLPALMFGALLLVFTGVITSARFRLLLEALMILPAAVTARSVTRWVATKLRRRPQAARRSEAPLLAPR